MGHLQRPVVDNRHRKLRGGNRLVCDAHEAGEVHLKIFHFFSHGNTLDRLAGNNELIFDLEHAVKDLIDAITETDRRHMDTLIAATQV